MKWVLILIIVACNAAGDLLDAAGMKHHGEIRHFGPRALAHLIASLIHNRYVIAGLCAMATAFLAQMSLLSISDLSFALPASASSYFVETLLAKWILGEKISRTRWMGACFVACGVALLTF
ncbi:MAG: EamA family transporter [Acidobacteriia bacterium]|nr:EamA family transporter [Terriglobia bacterium]